MARLDTKYCICICILSFIQFVDWIVFSCSQPNNKDKGKTDKTQKEEDFLNIILLPKRKLLHLGIQTWRVWNVVISYSWRGRATSDVMFGFPNTPSRCLFSPFLMVGNQLLLMRYANFKSNTRKKDEGRSSMVNFVTDEGVNSRT